MYFHSRTRKQFCKCICVHGSWRPEHDDIPLPLVQLSTHGKPIRNVAKREKLWTWTVQCATTTLISPVALVSLDRVFSARHAGILYCMRYRYSWLCPWIWFKVCCLEHSTTFCVILQSSPTMGLNLRRLWVLSYDMWSIAQGVLTCFSVTWYVSCSTRAYHK